MRMMVQGLGPGFTTVATRRSVIFNVDGPELVFTPFALTSMDFPESRVPPSASAEDFRTSRRPNLFPLLLLMETHPLGLY
jgi:hypothetical protein